MTGHHFFLKLVLGGALSGVFTCREFKITPQWLVSMNYCINASWHGGDQVALIAAFSSSLLLGQVFLIFLVALAHRSSILFRSGYYNQVLPYILMGVLTLISGLLSILMPETKGIPLPEALSQVQSLNWCCGWCRGRRRGEKTQEILSTKM